MYDYSKNNTKGTTPYTAPRFVIYENKVIKYDETGRIRAIVDAETKTQKEEKCLKKRLFKFFTVAFAVCLVLEIVKCTFFTFSAKKWQEHPKLRPAIIHNLIKISSPNTGEKVFIDTITLNEKSFTEELYVQKYENMRKLTDKDSLLFLTVDEVHSILGEPDPGVNDSFFDDLSERYSAEYFYAYPEDNGSVCWVAVEYYDNIVIRILER